MTQYIQLTSTWNASSQKERFSYLNAVVLAVSPSSPLFIIYSKIDMIAVYPNVQPNLRVAERADTFHVVSTHDYVDLPKSQYNEMMAKIRDGLYFYYILRFESQLITDVAGDVGVDGTVNVIGDVGVTGTVDVTATTPLPTSVSGVVDVNIVDTTPLPVVVTGIASVAVTSSVDIHVIQDASPLPVHVVDAVPIIVTGTLDVNVVNPSLSVNVNNTVSDAANVNITNSTLPITFPDAIEVSGAVTVSTLPGEAVAIFTEPDVAVNVYTSSVSSISDSGRVYVDNPPVVTGKGWLNVGSDNSAFAAFAPPVRVVNHATGVTPNSVVPLFILGASDDPTLQSKPLPIIGTGTQNVSVVGIPSVFCSNQPGVQFDVNVTNAALPVVLPDILNVEVVNLATNPANVNIVSGSLPVVFPDSMQVENVPGGSLNVFVPGSVLVDNVPGMSLNVQTTGVTTVQQSPLDWHCNISGSVPIPVTQQTTPWLTSHATTDVFQVVNAVGTQIHSVLDGYKDGATVVPVQFFQELTSQLGFPISATLVNGGTTPQPPASWSLFAGNAQQDVNVNSPTGQDVLIAGYRASPTRVVPNQFYTETTTGAIFPLYPSWNVGGTEQAGSALFNGTWRRTANINVHRWDDQRTTTTTLNGQTFPNIGIGLWGAQSSTSDRPPALTYALAPSGHPYGLPYITTTNFSFEDKLNILISEMRSISSQIHRERVQHYEEQKQNQQVLKYMVSHFQDLQDPVHKQTKAITFVQPSLVEALDNSPSELGTYSVLNLNAQGAVEDDDLFERSPPRKAWWPWN